jgi:magnesium transporter
MPDGDDAVPGGLAEILEQEGLDRDRLREILAPVHPVDLAELLDDVDLEDRVRIFEALDPDRAAQVLAAMPHDYKVELVRRMGEDRLAEVIDRMPDAAVADIIDELPRHKERAILEKLEREKARDVEELRRYPPHTAGGRMTRNFVTVPDTFTAGETIRAIQGAVDPHTVDFVYVVDDAGRLRGVLSLPRLMIHGPETPVSSFMRKDVIFVGPATDQEEVARLAQKYRLRHVPVVDNDMRLLGVVTLQDIIEVIQHEASEDMMKLAGVGMVDSLHTPLRARFRMRLPWLYLTLGGELFIALVLSRIFRATLERASILAAFMPAIMATGGNVGLQSTTMVIRGLGMGTLHRGQFLRVLAREFRLGLLLGVSCGVAASGVAVALEWGHAEVFKLGAAVFAAMVSATAATSLVGTLEPLVLHRLGRDPAAACGPFVTMFNDLFGTTVYFLIATLLGFSAAGAV